MPNPVLTRAIDALASRQDLGSEQTAEVLAEIMRGEASEIEISAFLIALRTKGETVQELAGLARTMRALAAAVPVSRENLLDTAGTGGGRRTFNVSTTAALIAAGAGCGVAKHGNRSATGLSGSADLLEALGARIHLSPEQVASCIQEAGFGFMFAPEHHAATRFVVPVRSGLAVRTVFNLLGPLTNPAGAPRQLIGVADASFLETIAGALAVLGTERALVVSGRDGIDEVSTAAPTEVVEVNGPEIRRWTLDPEEVGVPLLASADLDQIAGGAPKRNAEIAIAIFEGETGPRADFAILNAGAAIYVAGAVQTIGEGVQAARQAIADGSATAALQRYVEASRRHAPEVSAAEARSAVGAVKEDRMSSSWVKGAEGTEAR